MAARAKFQRIEFLTAFLMITAGWPSVAPATPVTYVVDFSGVGKFPNPAQGVFKYDAAVSQFSNFLVRWDDTVFDLTSEANAPLLSGVACAGESSSSPAVGFALMSKTLPCAGTVYNWVGNKDAISEDFVFFAGGPARSWRIGETVFDSSLGIGNGFGDWTMATAAPGTNPYKQFLPFVALPCSLAGGNYSINFSGVGKLPVAGCFNYDAATSVFSNFLVTWDDTVFDLTSEANAPLLSGVACAGESSSSPVVGFALMSKTLPCAGTVYNWVGNKDAISEDFVFFAGGPARSWRIGETVFDSSLGIGNGFGDWTITAVGPSGPPGSGTVPEPSTIILVLAALLLVARSKILKERPLHYAKPKLLIVD